MTKIKRKYLLNNSIISLIMKHALKKHKITQFYTTITALRSIRYTAMDHHYFKSVQHDTGASMEKEEIETTRKKFKKRFKERINDAIRKDRYLFHLEGREYVIDLFKKELQGLSLLEVEFPDIEAFEKFELPQMLQIHVNKEVSFDDTFKSKNLILDGMPQKISKLENIFVELDTKTHDELEHYFIPDLSPIDALRTILYKYSLLILHYKERMLAQDQSEDLHQFRINIRKSRAFLKEFDFLFPDKEYAYFSDSLSFFAAQTNHKRDLDVIQERLKKVDTGQDAIGEKIASQCENEIQVIKEMLQSKGFGEFFQIYQDALKKETLLTSYNTESTIKHIARKVIGDLHQNILKKINALEKDFSEKKLHRIRIAFKKLRYLLEEFQHIFGEAKIEEMIEKGKKLQTLLGEFNDAVNQTKLLHDYVRSQKKNISNPKGLERRLLKETSKSQKKMLKQTRKKLHKFKKKAFEL